MRNIIVLLFLTVFQVFANETYSQKTKLSLDLSDVTVEELLSEIENQTEFYFLCNKKLVDIDRMVNVQLNDKDINQVLAQVFDGTNTEYIVIDRQIILSPKNHLAEIRGVMQPITVTGQVVDDSGEPLPAVNITIQGTMTGTITDVNGNYSIEVPSNEVTLVFSYIGMETQEIPVGSSTTINVVMETSTFGIAEIVAIGYGVQRKSDITGAVSSVSSDELSEMSTYTPAVALQGRAAGVTVIRESGSPDATAEIRIRGIGTTNNISPLFVVDGLPVSDIDYLNPRDIESIEVLKDASSCAIYGSRGANGVILVTTKKGQQGALTVNLDASYGIESPRRAPDMMNSQQYAELSNEAYINAGELPIYPNPNNLEYDTDWFDEVSQTGINENYNLSFSGGSERMNARLSTGYYNRKGIVKTTNFQRLSFLQNTAVKATDFLNLETSLSGVFSNSKRLDPTTVFLSSLMAPPDLPVIDPATDYYSGIQKIRLVNPAGRIARNNADYRNNYLTGHFTAAFTIVEGLNFRSRFGVNYQNSLNSDFSPSYFETADLSNLLSTVSRSTSKRVDWTWENILDYHRLFNDIHDLTVMGAMSSREFNEDSFSASKQDVPIPQEEFWYLDAATQNPQADGDGASLSMVSYLGRINYILKNRYLITASIRADGSSRFMESNRWGYFPSGAVAWRISEEDFFNNMNIGFINDLKFRVSYGEIGNENIGSYYPYLTPVTQQQYYTLGTSQERINGAGLSGIGNAAVQWETAKQFNVGIDLSLLASKLVFTGDYYIRETANILLNQQVPRISGTRSIVRNVGGMENRGFEFELTYRERINQFNYNVSLNLATVKNEVTNLGTSDALVSSMPYYQLLIDFQGSLGSMLRSEVGRPYRQFYGWQTDGIFQNQGEIDQYTYDGSPIQPDAQPGDFRFKDLNNDGTIDDDDKTFIGNPYPDITFGLSFNASYKQFDMSVLIQGQAGNDVYNAAKYYFMRFDGRQNVRSDFLSEYWQGENSTESHPALTSDMSRNDRNYRNSDFYIEDGSYVKVRNLQIGYTFSPNFSGTDHRWRLYFGAENLLTLTGYSGFEPEIPDIGVDRGIYPQTRIFMIGANINF